MINSILRLSDMHPDNIFIEQYSDWIHDFMVLSVENGSTYGICYPETRRTYTYLAKHESEKDLVNTSTHEPIHSCLADFQFYSEDPEDMDIKQEHKIIQKMAWVQEERIFDKDYFSLINDQQVKPEMSESEYNRLMKRFNKEADKLSECN